jgi:P27 family predicted phage terminase small subunit
MGLRGPAPKPSVLEEAQGRPGHSPRNDAEPQFARVIPECPDHLSRQAQKVWAQLAPMLFEAKLLTEGDGIMLANLCQAYATMTDAQKKLNRERVTSQTKSGYKQQNPLFSIIRSQMDLITKLSREFGLSPSSRSRLSVAEDKKAHTDLLDDALFSRGITRLRAVPK